jgi:PmbA protein
LVSGAERVPLSGITLSGNIWDVLNNIIAATPEEEAVPSSTWLVSPLVALDGITVTG